MRNDATTPIEYCNGKPIYDKKGAQTAKNKRMKQDHVKLRIYHCTYCNGWHLTSKGTWNQK